MDEHRFDEWTRALTATAGSRRGVLRILAGGTLASLLARLGLSEAGARCGHAGDRCGPGRGRCCSRFACCGGRCRNLLTDERFCGGCLTPCDSGETCVGAACQPANCTTAYVCNGTETTCGAGSPCLCVRTLEDALACVDTCTSVDCTSTPQCVSELGNGFVCQDPGSGCCGQKCVQSCSP